MIEVEAVGGGDIVIEAKARAARWVGHLLNNDRA